MGKWEKIGGAAFGAFAVLIAIWMVGNYFGLNKESWPAWVQAIGAIATIAAAFVITQMQERTAFKQHVITTGMATKDRLGGILAIAERARFLIKKLEDEHLGDEESANEFRRTLYQDFAAKLAYAKNSLLAIPLHEVNNYSVVVVIQEITQAVENAQADLAAICEADALMFFVRYEQHGKHFGRYAAVADYAVENISIQRHSVPMTVIW
ncbi:hypothetical protein [Noviherbaspirillum suwonense]|uniref:SMODS and SLOG-associating 2TM effector domain-containing protein n=1 Tax=Noviherbaspirillum suwonense TaxID=1224511 RepID=A0ABY1QJ46_9BURK|nr:hypothetical protein [Noviherbaspirillum suwonense]SMP72796.1 hypothetical protein SAMN06295970_118116 [Noviherbaspirillum suwonense]